MLEFKSDFIHPVRHTIEIVVDNARTHTAQLVNINDFRLHPNGHCPCKTLEFMDKNENVQTINCYDEAGISKGLKKIAVELGYELPEKIKIEDLRKLLIQHPAFCPVKKLTKLAEKYGVKILFCPKFHCELNLIEGLWCNQKSFIRKRTDRTFLRLNILLTESRDHFESIGLIQKLIRRFWNCLFAYKNGSTYKKIMITYFSGKCKGQNTSHTKISNSQLEDIQLKLKFLIKIKY